MNHKKYRNSLRNHFSVHWTFLLVLLWFVVINLLSDFSTGGWIWSGIMMLSLLVSIFLHDIAQAITGILCNIRVRRVILLPIGAFQSISKKPKRKSYEIIMLSSGIVTNLAIAAILAFFLQPYSAYSDEPQNMGAGYGGNFLYQLQFMNLCLGCLNLIPVFPMDAGRILDSFLDDRVSSEQAVKIVNRVSFIVATMMLATGILLMKYPPMLLSLFIFFTIPLGKYYHPLKSRIKIVRRINLPGKNV